MEAFTDMNMTPFWDLSQASQFSQLPDDDFLALLQKQFPAVGGDLAANNTFDRDSVNPRNVTSFPPPTFSPPSEESSPSPPSSSKDSTDGRNEEELGETPLKRKASQDDLDNQGPSHKTQHTGRRSSRLSAARRPQSRTPSAPATSTSSKKGTSHGRRKSAGGQAGGSSLSQVCSHQSRLFHMLIATQEEQRLLKRKEQNRAAQRAFRERKEKHVKDVRGHTYLYECDLISVAVGRSGSCAGGQECRGELGEPKLARHVATTSEREHGFEAGAVHIRRPQEPVK